MEELAECGYLIFWGSFKEPPRLGVAKPIVRWF